MKIFELSEREQQAIDAFGVVFGVAEPDPLPVFRELRDEHGHFVPGVGRRFADRVTIARNFDLPEIPTLMAVTYASVREVLGDAERFSPKVYDELGGEDSIATMEGTRHQRLRRLLAQGLSPRSVKIWDERMIRPVVKRLLDACPRGEVIDLGGAFALPLPATAIGAVLGLPESDLQDFYRWSLLQITAWVHEEGMRALVELRDYFTARIQERRALAPAEIAARDDILSLLVRARDGANHDDSLTDSEILGLLHFLIFAGSDTTFHTMENVFFHLAEDPALFRRVKEHRELVPELIEEVLRLHPPGPIIGRRAKLDTEVLGRTIADGTPIAINLMMANRDPAVFENPDVLDVERANKKTHVSFGNSTHICPGMHLARLEMPIALNEFLDRFDSIRWDPASPKAVTRGMGTRSPSHLNVILS